MPLTQFDSAIELSLDLMRTDAAIRQEVLVLLEALERDLIGRLSGSELTTWGRNRVEKQLAEINKAIKGYYTQASAIVIDSTKEIAQVVAGATATALGAGTAVVPTEAVLSTLATNAMIQGAAQAAWWKKQSDDTAFRFQRAVRQGLVNAEANGSIIARVRTELGISQRHAASLVQTSVQTVANEARMLTFQANLDVIKRFRWVTALDSKVCILCAPRDGLEWTKNGLNPIGHKFEWKMPPIHFNDRCLIIPVIFDGPPGGQRASMDGPVEAKMTFDGWLSRQSKARQNTVLGPGRADLYRSGKLSLQDLVSGTGRPLKLKALKQKYGGNS